jgi:hypothetical protein
MNRGGRRASRDDDGVPVAGVPEDGGVLVVCLAGAERRRSGWTTARPSGGGA